MIYWKKLKNARRGHPLRAFYARKTQSLFNDRSSPRLVDLLTFGRRSQLKVLVIVLKLQVKNKTILI